MLKMKVSKMLPVVGQQTSLPAGGCCAVHARCPTAATSAAAWDCSKTVVAVAAVVVVVVVVVVVSSLSAMAPVAVGAAVVAVAAVVVVVVVVVVVSSLSAMAPVAVGAAVVAAAVAAAGSSPCKGWSPSVCQWWRMGTWRPHTSGSPSALLGGSRRQPPAPLVVQLGCCTTGSHNFATKRVKKLVYKVSYGSFFMVRYLLKWTFPDFQFTFSLDDFIKCVNFCNS